jgi:D-proline reductase (dithiol) PrdB
LEEAGIPTIYIGSCRDMMLRLMPPRSAFLNFPLGRQCGKPNDADLQTSILRAALEVLVNASTPGEIVDLPFAWGSPFDWKSYMHDLDAMVKEEGIQAQEWKP